MTCLNNPFCAKLNFKRQRGSIYAIPYHLLGSGVPMANAPSEPHRTLNFEYVETLNLELN